MSPRLVWAVRYALPAAICLVGLVFLDRDPGGNFEGAMALIGAGLSVLLVNLLFRFGVAGDRDRADEDAARREFDRTGRWPDEDPGSLRPARVGIMLPRSTDQRGKSCGSLLPDGRTANAAYRSIGPMQALAARGHDLRELELSRIDGWHDLLAWCEVLHVHRVCDGGAVELARAAKQSGRRRGVGRRRRRHARSQRHLGLRAQPADSRARRRLAARTRLFAEVDLVTTPSAHLAGVFRAGGAREARVLENYVIDDFAHERELRDALRIGWVARRHRLDLRHSPMPGAGAPARGPSARARDDDRGQAPAHRRPLRARPIVPLPKLQRHISRFSIGIAPLSPALAINQARSNVKLKEYAAADVPWLASPIGPYVGLGERQGGRLVADDRWFEELDALVRSERARRRLAKRASRWGATQLLSRNVGDWERNLAWAIDRARAATHAA